VNRNTLFARLPSRAYLALLLPALLSGLLLAAANASAMPSPWRAVPAAPAGAERLEAAGLAPTGAFTAALSADVVGLDPALLTDSNSLRVTGQVYETLVAYESGDSKPAPALAESWSVSADGKTWTFNLRPGVKFHDGSSLDAAAVVLNIERWWDPANPYHSGSFETFGELFNGFKGETGCLLEAVSGAPGSLQVQIVTTLPDSRLLSRLAEDAFGIATPAAIQAGTLGDSPSGTGPFRFIERMPGDHVRLAANFDYWGGAALLDALTFRVIQDEGQRYDALAAGAVQSADAFSNARIAAAAADPDLRLLWRVSPSLGYLGINRAHGPLGNPLVRQAIAHAINRPGLIAGHYDIVSQAAGQFLPPIVWGYDSNLPGYSYNPALARSLLAQAGYSGGFTTTLALRNVSRAYLPDPLGTANAIAANLQAVGIDAEVTVYPSSEFLEKVDNGELDLFLLGWFAENPHPANFFAPLFCDPESKGFGPLDTELCDQIDAADATFDLDDQLAIYTWASDRVYDTLPALALANQRRALITRFDVTGLTPSFAAAENYEHVGFAQAQGEVTPADGGAISYTDAGGQATTAAVPAGAVTEAVTLRLSEASTASPPAGFGFGDQAFEMTAYRDGNPLPGFAFETPVVLTVEYSEADIARLQESSLVLYLKIGDAWIDAAETCSPALPYAIDALANRVSVSVCHLTDFALFGEKKPLIFLPLIVK
jgi:peptide/nickel transport system substrate-binding protein